MDDHADALPAWPPSLITGVVAGLLGGTALTLLTALRMGRLRSRYADKRADTGRKMWLTGWSLDRADLRPAHFLATHMMQAIPLASVLVARLFPAVAALVLSTGMALAWAALTLHTFRQTVKGRTLGDILHQAGVAIGKSAARYPSKTNQEIP